MKDLLKTIAVFSIASLTILSAEATIAPIDHHKKPSSVQEQIADSLLSNSIVSDAIQFIQRSTPSNTSGSISLKRHLAIGDFAELNKLFQGAVIGLPDASITDRVIGITLTLDITNLRCEQITVGDIIIDYNKDSNQRLRFKIDVVALGLICYLDYDYRYGLLRGGGSADAYTSGNSAAVTIGFQSSDFSQSPPSDLAVEACETNINIVDLDFRGGIVSSILDTFERLIRGTIEGEIRSVACSELRSIGKNFADDALGLAKDFIDPLLEPLDPEYQDPLFAELSLSFTEDTELVNFQDLDSTVGGWFKSALEEADDFLGMEMDDPDSTFGIFRDLGINVLLRDHLLDEDRAFVVDVDSLDFAKDGIIHEGHDRLTETTIYLDRVKVFGLDTFRKFDPLNFIGNFTIQNELKWEFLTIEIDLTIEIKPSTIDDSLIQRPGAEKVVEKTQVKFGVDDIDAVVSILLAVDQKKLGRINLGSLLDLDNLLPCILSGLDDVQVSEITASVGNIRDPVLDGFVSPGIDRVVSQTVEAMFLMYESTMLKAVPNFFQKQMRDIVNNDVIKNYVDKPENALCPAHNFRKGAIDFRDLFLKPMAAVGKGGVGDQPYGDIASTLLALLEEQLFSTDESGLPKINKMVLKPLTKSQSGTAGTISQQELFDFVKEQVSSKVEYFVDRFRLAAYNLRVENIDTITAPFTVLEPTTSSYTLTNMINFGPVEDRDLTMKVRMLMELEGGTPLDMKNEFDLIVSVPSSTLSADFFAKIDGEKFGSFPLQDIANSACWFEKIERSNFKPEISIPSFILSFADFNVGAECIACESEGVAILPELTKLLDQTGGVRTLSKRLEMLADEVVMGGYVQDMLNRLAMDSAKNCPHSRWYTPGSNETSFSGIGFPDLSQEAIETIIYTAALVGEVGLIVFAEDRNRSPKVLTNPLSAQAELDLAPNKKLLDFNDLSDSIGSLLDAGISDLRSYLSDEVEDPKRKKKDLGINLIIRDYLLQDGEKFSFEFDDDSFRVGNIYFDLRALKVVGLDTLTSVDIVQAIAAQTTMNKLVWERLSLELDFNITIFEDSSSNVPMVGPETVTISLGFEDVAMDVGLFAAMDIDKMGAIELGSLLTSDRIFGCMMRMIDKVELTQMTSTVGRVTVPTLKGFMSDDLRNNLIQSVEIAFEKYQDELVKGFPIIIDETLRPLLNGALVAYTERPNVQCLSNEEFESDAVVDFRDLFMSKEDALEAGSSGQGPYGDVAAFVKTFINKELLEIDPNSGEPPINNVIIRPLTKDQSGVEGVFLVNGTISGFETDSAEKFGVETFLLEISDAQLYNLDTLGHPLAILEPNSTDGGLVNNEARIGVGNNSVGAEIKFLLKLSGDPQLSMSNEMKIGVEIGEATVAATALARLSERGFMKFPIRDVFNMDCWLSALAFVDLDENGNRRIGTNSSVSIETLESIFDDLGFNISCSNCTSPGLKSLSDVTDILDRTGVTDEFETRIVDFLTELVQSDYVQTTLDRLVHDATMKCPHSPRFVENSTAIDYPGVRFPTLSRDSIETVVFAGAIAVDVASVLVGKSHAETVVEPSNPLYLQEDINSVVYQKFPDTRLLDFTNLEKDIGAWAESGLKEATKYLQGEVDDVGGPNGDSDLGVNVLVRSLLLGKNKAFSVNLDSISVSQNGMEITLNEARIYGFDSFTKFSALDFIGRQTIQNKFGWQRLSVELDIKIIAGSAESKRMLQEGEKLTVSFGVKDVDTSSSLFLAVDQKKLTSMTLGSLLKIDQIFPCMLSTAVKVEVTELGVKVGDIEQLDLKGFLSSKLGKVLNATTDALMQEYGDMVIAAIPAVFDQSVRALANNWMSYYLNLEDSTACPSFSLETKRSREFIDLRDLLLPVDMSRMLGGAGDSRYGDLFRGVLDFINSRVLSIDETTGSSGVNDFLIAPLTEAQSGIPGTLHYQKNLLDTGNQVIDLGGFRANIELKAHNARVENLDTVGAPLSILDPLGPHNISNTASFGTGKQPLRFAIDFLISVLGDENLQMRNEVEISLDLKSTTVVLEALMLIGEDPFVNFPLQDLSNLDCWLATLPAPQLDSRGVRMPGTSPTAALTNLVITLARLNLNVTCISCSSPQMNDLSELLSTPKAVASTTKVGNDLLGYATQLLEGEFLQIQIDRRLMEAPKRCPHHPDYDPDAAKATYAPFTTPERKDDTVTFLITLAVVMACLILAVVFIVLVVKFIVARRNRSWLRTLPEHKLLVINKIQSEEKAKQAELNRATRSMFLSPEIPLYVRLLMPLILVGNIAFFLSGHLSLGATVNVEAQLAGEKIVIEKFFEFSMAQSTLDIWRAGGKELAIFILVFSGVWPYTKQLIALTLWFLPPTVVSISRRGSIFLWLDALAKWSIADIFVLLVSMAAFRVSINSPDVDFLPDNFYSIDLRVTLLWGLYANMIAQLISQVSSHFIIHYHRRIEEVASRDYDRRIEDSSGTIQMGGDDDSSDESLTKKECLKFHGFTRPHRGESDKLQVHGQAGAVLSILSVVLSILIVVGCSLPSFSIESLGIIGVFIESGQEFRQAMVNHSVFTITKLLFDEARDLGAVGDYFGLGTLAVLLLLSVLIVPICQGIALVYQWLAPLTRRQRNRLNVFIETLQGWQYVEVYLLAVIISSWQLGPTSEFMINSYCANLDGTFAALVKYGILEPDDAQCFQVRAGVEDATFILIAAAIVLALMNTFVQKAVRQYERDHSKLVSMLHDDAKLVAETQTLGTVATDDEVDALRLSIKPSPVLFTDTFRWCLRREDAVLSTKALQGLDEEAKLGAENSFIGAAAESGVVLSNSDHPLNVELEAESFDESSSLKNSLNEIVPVLEPDIIVGPITRETVVEENEEN